jgi:hypothetical protein
MMSSSGLGAGLWAMGVTAASAVILTVTAKLALYVNNWTIYQVKQKQNAKTDLVFKFVFCLISGRHHAALYFRLVCLSVARSGAHGKRKR